MSADLSAIPQTSLLDVSANKTKAQLSNSGSIASRRKPTKQSPSPISSAVSHNSLCFHFHNSTQFMGNLFVLMQVITFRGINVRRKQHKLLA